MIVTTHSPHETEVLGFKLGTLLRKGAFVALFGDLGGGKTCFTRGVVAAVAPESLHLVSSPTFAIMNEYQGPLPVYHFDFYRLNSGHEITELGFEDYFQGDGICIAEWSERVGDLLPKDHIKLSFEHAEGDLRKISLAADSPESQVLIDELKSQLNTEEFL